MFQSVTMYFQLMKQMSTVKERLKGSLKRAIKLKIGFQPGGCFEGTPEAQNSRTNQNKAWRLQLIKQNFSKTQYTRGSCEKALKREGREVTGRRIFRKRKKTTRKGLPRAD